MVSYQIRLNDQTFVWAQTLRPDKFIIAGQTDLVSLAENAREFSC